MEVERGKTQKRPPEGGRYKRQEATAQAAARKAKAANRWRR
jgi:hypothetical protein